MPNQESVDLLGDIPPHWKIVPAWSLYRRVKRTGYENEELLSVYRDHGVIPKSSRDDNHNIESEDLSGYQLVKTGDLVMNKMKAWQGSIALSDHQGIVSPAYFVFQPLHNGHLKYFHYLLRSKQYIGAYNRISKGVRIGQWDLDPAYFRTLPIPVPPVAEQKAIADFLDTELGKIDVLITKQLALIDTLKTRIKSTIANAVLKGLSPSARMIRTSVGWVGEIPQHWDLVRTRYLVDITTGSGDTADAADDGPYPFYVRSDTPLTSNTWEFDGDAVLTAGDGAGVGKVFHLVSGRFMAHQRVYVMNRFKRVQPKYFFYFFSALFASVALDGSAKSTVDSLRRPTIANMYCTVPPISEQLEIISYLDRKVMEAGTLVAKTEQVVSVLRERRAALISAAVTGKIEVPGRN